MHKTRKSMAKRFKVTGTGKVMRRTPGRRHMLRKKNKKQIRRSSIDKSVAPGLVRQIKVGAPYLF